MRFFIGNMGQAEPDRYVPAGPTDCENAVEYRKAVDNAAARISYYQDLMQQAVQAGNSQAVDRARAGADLANRDWAAWSRVLKNCGQAPAAPVGVAPEGPNRNWALVALVGVALVAATAFARPDIGSWLSKPKRR